MESWNGDEPVGGHGPWYNGDNTRWPVKGGPDTTIGLNEQQPSVQEA